jgi:hypothetical protein
MIYIYYFYQTSTILKQNTTKCIHKVEKNLQCFVSLVTVMLLIGGNRKRKWKEMFKWTKYVKYYILNENTIYSQSTDAESNVPFYSFVLSLLAIVLFVLLR